MLLNFSHKRFSICSNKKQKVFSLHAEPNRLNNSIEIINSFKRKDKQISSLIHSSARRQQLHPESHSNLPRRKLSKESIQRTIIKKLSAYIQENSSFPPADSDLIVQSIANKIHSHQQFYSIFLLITVILRDKLIYDSLGHPQLPETHIASQIYLNFLQHTHEIPTSLAMKILKGYHLKYLHSSYIMKLVASLPNNLTTRTFLDALLLDAIDCRRPFHADTIYFARMNDGERMIYSVDKTKLMTLLTQFKIFDKATNLLEDSKDGSESINFVMHIVFYYVKNRELKMFDYALGKLSREKMEILESEKKIAVVNAMEGSAVNDADEFIKEIEYKNEKQDDSTVEFVEGSDFLFHSIVYLAMKTGGSDYAVEAVEIMIKHKIQLSNQALNRLLHSLIKTDNTGLSINLYKKIEAANYKPNIIAQTTFIKSLLDRNLVNEAIDFVENKEMNIEGSNLVLHYYTQEQNFVKAIETFNRFTARDEYVAEKSTMTLLMTSATTMRQVKEVRTMAFTLFESERGENQVDMNEDHRWIDTLIHALGRCEAPEEAELLAKYYVKQGYRPSVWTFSSLIGSWGKCEEYERACKWYDWMIRDFDYIEKNILIYNALLHAAARSKLSQSDKLVEIEKWEAILNKETKKDITTFNILISFYISEGYLMKLELLFKEMENTNVPVGMQTCLRVCQSYSRKNDLKNALIWYKKLKGLSSRDMFLAWKSIMKLYEVTKDLKGMLVFMNTIKSHPQFTLNSLMVSQLSKLFVNLDMDECLTRMIQNDYAHLPDPLPEILSNELSRSSNLFQVFL